jgi:hypothetical protein
MTRGRSSLSSRWTTASGRINAYVQRTFVPNFCSYEEWTDGSVRS